MMTLFSLSGADLARFLIQLMEINIFEFRVVADIYYFSQHWGNLII